MAVVLSAFGGVIELLQAIPAIHRDSSLDDWFADNIVIGLTLMVIWMVRFAFGRRQ